MIDFMKLLPHYAWPKSTVLAAVQSLLVQAKPAGFRVYCKSDSMNGEMILIGRNDHHIALIRMIGDMAVVWLWSSPAESANYDSRRQLDISKPGFELSFWCEVQERHQMMKRHYDD